MQFLLCMQESQKTPAFNKMILKQEFSEMALLYRKSSQFKSNAEDRPTPVKDNNVRERFSLTFHAMNIIIQKLPRTFYHILQYRKSAFLDCITREAIVQIKFADLLIILLIIRNCFNQNSSALCFSKQKNLYSTNTIRCSFRSHKRIYRPPAGYTDMYHSPHKSHHSLLLSHPSFAN